jgi:hypothetical protein
MEDDTTLDAIAKLTLPRYRLSDYEDSRAAKTPRTRSTSTTSAQAAAT